MPFPASSPNRGFPTIRRSSLVLSYHFSNLGSEVVFPPFFFHTMKKFNQDKTRAAMLLGTVPSGNGTYLSQAPRIFFS